MDASNAIANDLFYKIRSRFSGLKLGTETGEITINPEEARFFDFDYMEGEKPVGHVSISLAEPNSMKVYFSSGITESMDQIQKNNWYGFLKELRQFAKRRLLAFDTRDIAKDNLDKRDYAFLSQTSKPQPETPNIIQKPVGESVMSESAMYGTKTVSYQKLLDTRLIIKHSQALNDDLSPGARTRNISALFVENQDGERFKYPFIHLAGARAMQRHVANGGLPYDDLGKSIVQMSEELAQLKSFSNYVVRNDLMNSDTNNLVERSRMQLEALREKIHKISKQSHYEAYKESFQTQQPIEVPEDVIEDYTEKFTVKNFKEDIKSVFPVLYRLMQEENTIGYDDIVAMTTESEIVNDEADIQVNEDPMENFESWVMALGEESAIMSQDQEERQMAVDKLQNLVGEHFPAGTDGSNAIEALKGIIDDPALYAEIKEAGKTDPDTCVRPLVKDWLEQNSPEVLDELDFGDLVDEDWKKKLAAAALAGSMALGGAAHAGDDKKTDKIDTDQKVVQVDKSKKDGDTVSPSDAEKTQLKLRPSFKRAATEDNESNVGVKELAEFIHSFYDKESGTFPKGPEGVCTMVGKKFGEQAEHIARKFVERMAPQQTTENNPELAELARVKELSGIHGDSIDELSRGTVKSYAEKKMSAVKDRGSASYYDKEKMPELEKDLKGLKGAQDRLKGKKSTSENSELDAIRKLSGMAKGLSL